MHLLYQSASYIVVQFDVPVSEGASDERLLSRGGFEIVDKFARKEIFVDARNYVSSTGMSDEGAAALYDARRLVTFAGRINTGAYEYGKDWEFGDRLYVMHEGVRVDCIVHSVSIRLAQGREDVVAELRSL